MHRVYTDADYTLYADIPGLTPLHQAPGNHCLLGPILWSPEGTVPLWWNQLPEDRPSVYVTLGSSGQSQLLAPTLRALADLDVLVMAATAGRFEPDTVPGNAHIAEFLPGGEAARRACLVVCNGGSPTTQQALVHGTPVLGIPSNLDQYLNMQGVCAAGAGCIVRSERATAPVIRAAVEEMLADGRYAEDAQRLAKAVKKEVNALQRFRALLSSVLRMALL